MSIPNQFFIQIREGKKKSSWAHSPQRFSHRMTPTGNKFDFLTNMQNPKALRKGALYKKYKLHGKIHHKVKGQMRKYWQLTIQQITMLNNGELLSIEKEKKSNREMDKKCNQSQKKGECHLN